MPLDTELIMSGPEEKCYYVERWQFKMDKEGVNWKVSSPVHIYALGSE